MSSMKSAEFKRSFLKEVQARPIIWNHTGWSNHEAEAAWKELAQHLGRPLDKLKNIWAFLSKRYQRILMTKTIERNTDHPGWILFHDMSFLYEITVEAIKNKMGGIVPPLLQPKVGELPCPCCLPSSTPRKEISVLPAKESITPARRQPACRGWPLHVLGKGTQNTERKRFIEAIKSYPIVYDRDYPSKVPLCTAWKKIAEAFGISILTVQSRWRQYKQRYVNELMKERRKSSYRSSWPCFQQMSFMRQFVQADIDKLDKLRNEITQIIEQHKAMTDPESEGDSQCSDGKGQDEGVFITPDFVIESDRDDGIVCVTPNFIGGHESHLSEELMIKDEVICIEDDDDDDNDVIMC